MTLSWIKKVYLYLVSLISLIILVIAAIILINLALKTWVFTKADDNYYYPVSISCSETKNADGSVVPSKDPACTDPDYQEKERAAEDIRRAAKKQQDASQALAMIIIAAPVFLYHWYLARKEA